MTDDWTEYFPTDPELTSEAHDGFALRVNETELFFKCREDFPMIVEIYVADEEKPIAAINTARSETVTLGGISEGLARQVNEIHGMPLDEVPDALDELSHRLNPPGQWGSV
jgi:hypothetical protein